MAEGAVASPGCQGPGPVSLGEGSAPAARTVVVIGETGFGKSSVVNALRDAGAPAAEVGLAPQGVTKEVRAHGGSPGVLPGPWQVVDTPGIGAAHSPLPQQLAALEAVLSGERLGPVHGVLVACPVDSPRLMLGSRIAQALLQLGRVRWEQVVLVGTKADKAEPEDEAFFRDTLVPDFFRAAGGVAGQCAVVGRRGHEALVAALGELGEQPLGFGRPDAQELGGRLAELLGEEGPERLQAKLEAARAGPPARPPLCLLVVGECGDGKSTLINHLRDPKASEQLQTGKAPTGVTKDIVPVRGLAVDGRPVCLLDTPGIGDMDVSPVQLIALLEGVLANAAVQIDGLLITCPVTNKCLRLGGQVVRMLVELGLQGEGRWAGVVLVGTKADRADPEEVRNFREAVAPSFFPQAEAGEGRGRCAVCSCSPAGAQLGELLEAIGGLPARPVAYRPPAAEDLARALAAVLGGDVGSAQRTLETGRQERQLLEQLEDTKRAHQAEQAAAERRIRDLQRELQRHDSEQEEELQRQRKRLCAEHREAQRQDSQLAQQREETHRRKEQQLRAQLEQEQAERLLRQQRYQEEEAQLMARQTAYAASLAASASQSAEPAAARGPPPLGAMMQQAMQALQAVYSLAADFVS